LLSALDFKEGYLNMAILEPKAQTVKKAQDYKATRFKLKLDGINMVDKMELHRQTCEMVFRDLLQTSTVWEEFKQWLVILRSNGSRRR
jgi:hypothetical protein